MPRILALDPGTKHLGWALYDSARGLLETGVCFLRGTDVDDRCEQARQELIRLLPAECKVDVVATERMFATGHNSDAPLAVVAYLIRRRVKLLEIALVELSAGTWKKRTVGKGNATKADVMVWARERFRFPLHRQDEADAACIALAAVEDIEGDGHDDA